MPNEESLWLAINSVRGLVHFLVIAIGGIGWIVTLYLYPEEFSAGFVKAWIWVASICLLILAIKIPTTYPIESEGLDSFPMILIFYLMIFYVLLWVVLGIGSFVITWILRVGYVGGGRLIKKLNTIANTDE